MIMPGLKMITGNQKKVVQAAFSSSHMDYSKFISDAVKEVSYLKNISQVLLDLPRSHFLNTNGKTIDHLILDWVNVSDKTFTQGNITASVYELLMQLFILSSPKFINASRTEDDRQQF